MWHSSPDCAGVNLSEKLLHGARIIYITRIGDLLVDHETHLTLRDYVPVPEVSTEKCHLTERTSLGKNEIARPCDTARYVTLKFTLGDVHKRVFDIALTTHIA